MTDNKAKPVKEKKPRKPKKTATKPAVEPQTEDAVDVTPAGVTLEVDRMKPLDLSGAPRKKNHMVIFDRDCDGKNIRFRTNEDTPRGTSRYGFPYAAMYERNGRHYTIKLFYEPGSEIEFGTFKKLRDHTLVLITGPKNENGTRPAKAIKGLVPTFIGKSGRDLHIDRDGLILVVLVNEINDHDDLGMIGKKYRGVGGMIAEVEV